MKRILSLILALCLTLPIFFLFGCTETEEGQVLRICNCDDYINEDLKDKFTAETGIKIEYSTYGTNENLYNELVINPNSYDLVVPSEYMIEKLAVEGRIQKLDLDKVPNYKNNVSPYINKRLNDIEFTVQAGDDAGKKANISEYMVGYMWGTMGWVYATDKVPVEEVSSWDGVFANDNLKKRITIKDSVRDSYLIGLAMVYGEQLKATNSLDEITKILNNVESTAIDAVGEKINSIKPMLYGFEVDSGKNDIVNNNIDAYVAWSGDAAYAIDVAMGDADDEDGTRVEENKRRDLSYIIPEEGSNIWFDGLVMPSGSTNYDAVYKFLNFISDPVNVASNMNYIGYTSMVGGNEIYENIVLDWFDESADLGVGEGVEVDLSYFFGNDKEYKVTVSEESYGRLMAQYPEEYMLERCAIMSYFDNDTLVEINEMWEAVKGETFPLWIILLTVAIVLILAIIILLYRFKDKIKWLKFERNKKDYATKHNLKVVKKEKLN